MYNKTKARPKPQPECPRFEVINVVQFQFFDNGEKPGKGKSRHVVKLEVHCEGRLNLAKPYWKRSVSMLDMEVFFSWVMQQGFPLDIMAIYEGAAAVISDYVDGEDTEWVKLGHVEDTRLRTRYPGQFVVCRKLKAGPLECWLQLGEHRLPAAAMFFNKGWRKGSKARLFAGTYDPCGEYDHTKRIAAVEAEAESRAAARRLADSPDALNFEARWLR